MNFRQALRVQFGLILPLLYFLHGILYVQSGGASDPLLSIVVYAIKISYIGLVVIGLMIYGLKTFSNRMSQQLMVLLLVISCLNFIGALINYESISYFYLIADFLGYIAFGLFFSILRHHFYLEKNFLLEVFKLCTINIIGYALGLLVYYYISSGMKVSTPPDNTVAIALCLGIMFFNWRVIKSTDKIFVLLSIFIVIALSGMRVLIIIPLICFSFIGVQILYENGLKHFLALMVVVSLGFLSVSVAAGDQVADSLISVSNATLAILQQSDVSEVDASIFQRVIEAKLIFEQMNNNPSTYVFGAGFGALYQNTLINNEHYSYLQHHAHSTPIVVLFRNGLIGLIFYLLIFIISVTNLFSKNKIVSIAALAVFCQWLSALFDQYAYWAFNFAFSLAVMYVAIEKERQDKR